MCGRHPSTTSPLSSSKPPSRPVFTQQVQSVSQPLLQTLSRSALHTSVIAPLARSCLLDWLTSSSTESGKRIFAPAQTLFAPQTPRSEPSKTNAAVYQPQTRAMHRQPTNAEFSIGRRQTDRAKRDMPQNTPSSTQAHQPPPHALVWKARHRSATNAHQNYNGAETNHVLAILANRFLKKKKRHLIIMSQAAQLLETSVPISCHQIRGICRLSTNLKETSLYVLNSVSDP